MYSKLIPAACFLASAACFFVAGFLMVSMVASLAATLWIVTLSLVGDKGDE